MAKETANSIIAMLLVLTIIVSAIGSYVLLTNVSPATAEDDTQSTSGKVKLFVMNIAEPDSEGATVKLNVVK
ncbi:MAG: hypothetical protein KJ697_03450 [Nanoarchaeota archaeon]|nr:hypothetical protein [Nanoarchaeota archaeon]MBU4124171.1 hypothetical protein [Nanoarchaeota archaeon]